ncbi:YheT family hydrolase [Runella slithyformis]|uniref:Alpha/beta hydrolase fold protein n=1 Tax=Runella slithyformis (strain ATCC 29530 / DSM 19594 / LMG 11500 / NCIMB 11436 / LSU 4) TaxID=761193 RepID=A0A7U3ZIV3_RUNSL|nr:alpha/beta fold hydrolase [Runella slithyformis]AEI48034.1 alpha/beta hydrolase fold protein [Runella slithyformis DSM 19594]
MPVVRQSTYPGPPRYLFNGHLQTIIPSVFRKIEGVAYERERFMLSDGDFVDLDWLDTKSKKLVVLTHGLEGDSGRHYIKGTAKLFARHGWDVLAWNCRSCSGEMNKAFRLYNHGEIGDISELIDHALRTKHYEKIALVGYSMGGNISLKYVGVKGKDLPDAVQGVAAFSAPTNLKTSAELLDLPKNRLYRERFMKKLTKKITAKAELYPGKLDMERLKNVKVWKDFDDFFSAPVNGYRDADDFYEQASAVNFIKEVHIPVLICNAQNDPILNDDCAPKALAEKHRHIFVETPKTGGHVGFLVKNDEFTWAERRALTFLS